MNKMEKFTRVTALFEKVKHSLSNKNAPEWMHMMKRDVQALLSELLVLGKENQEMFVRSLAMEGYLVLLTAKSLPICGTEKLNLLQPVFEKLKPFVQREECLFVFLRIQNLLCYYLIQLEKNEQCREILEEMEELYECISKNPCARFIDAEDLFTEESVANIKQVSPDKIDKVVTNNIQMQAFLYNKINLPEKYVLYNHTALRRQLEMKEGTPQDWALRSARLGNYFTYLNQLGNARHHLCAAYYVLRTCHDRCKLIPTEFITQKSNFEVYFLELSHHWVKYGLNLLKLSKKKFLGRYFNQSNSTSGADLWRTVDFDEKRNCAVKFEDENMKDTGSEKIGKGDDNVSEQLFLFPTLDLKSMEAKVPVEILYDTDDARKVFVFTHKWLMRAKRYCNFELQPAQYTSYSLQLAELFEHLAFFERSLDNQYNIQKRRADVLENLAALLKTCDSMMSVQIDVIRELSQVQLELMALNLQKLWHEESQTNIPSMDSDLESIMNSLGSVSNKTLTAKNANTPSKNLFMRKMDAAMSINSRLCRLSEMLMPQTPSQLSFTKN